MATKYFNFNHERHITEIDVAENGNVTVLINGTAHHFDSVNELAENYAIARQVKADQLKNWVIVEDGDNISYVLRAATAGRDFFNTDGPQAPHQVSLWDNDDEEDDDDMTEEEYDKEYFFDRLDNTDKKILIGRYGYDYMSQSLDDLESVLEEELSDLAKLHKNKHTAYDIKTFIENIDPFTINEENNLLEFANYLAAAAWAKTQNVQVLQVNIDTQTSRYVRYPVSTPVRQSQFIKSFNKEWVEFIRN